MALEMGSPPQSPLSTPSSEPRKRRRVTLACTSCRRKKSRCNGARPTCSSCDSLELECVYEAPVPSATNANQDSTRPTYAALAERVKELEAELRRSKQDILTPPPTHEEKGVDILATEAFNDVPAADIGYFGPSSNHALFRCLASSFASDIMLLSQSQPANLPRIDASRTFLDSMEDSRRNQDTFDRSTKAYQIPRTQNTLHLITRFFSTVGLVLPYVEKSSLVSIIKPADSNTPRQSSRVEEALLSIICAYAALSTSTTDAYAYYQNTLNLLEERTLRGASLQLTQTLLLLCSFQQNTQRAIASWTYHALAVKAALQLGLQSSTSSDELSSQQCRLRDRVWNATIIQDRNLSLRLGRPFLIPSSFCQSAASTDLLGDVEASSAFHAVHSDSVTYFNHLVALSVIKSRIIEDLYDSNIGRVQSGDARKILVARLAIVFDLENWRRNCGISGSIPCFDDLKEWTMLTFHAQKFRVLLSLQYYGSLLSAYAPVLTARLSEHEQKNQKDHARPALADVELLAMKDDFIAAQELQQIIQRLFEYAPDFFDCYAVWWTCNYTMFTVCLHLFSALLICRQVRSTYIFQDLDANILRKALDAAMKTLESIERTSLMSWKGRHCLERFLHVLDLLEPQHSPPLNEPMDDDALQPLSTADFDTIYSQLVTQSVNDFMLESSQMDFLDADLRLTF